MPFRDAKKLGFTAALFLVAGLVTPMPASAIDDPCLSSTAIIGTSGDDNITGTPGDDVICTLAGNDSIEGLAGDDVIIAGDGDDRIISMEGNDYVEAGDGDDFVDAGDGDDELLGNPGDDILWGGLGIDEILGLAGNDTLDGGVGADSVDGGLDRDFCVRDKKDKKTLSCFYDTKAPSLKSVSVSASTRNIDTSVTGQWVRVKALITEAGSGLTDVGFTFVNFQSKSMPSFGGYGSLKYPDRLPTACSALKSLAETPPPISSAQPTHWCIEQQSSSAIVVEFLLAAPYRLAKGTYKLAGLILNDAALNQTSQNGLSFRTSVTQTASVPTGIPVLKSFAFLSDNKVNTASSSVRVTAEVAVSTGPSGFGGISMNFVRDIDRKYGDNLVFMAYDSERSAIPCDEKIAKAEQKQTCLLSSTGGLIKVIIVTTLPRNSPSGAYKFSALSISNETGKGTELDLDNLKKDARYEKFTKLAIVQTAASVLSKPEGTIEYVGISTDLKKIDTGSGPASFTVSLNVRRTGAAEIWPITGVVHAMHCPSGVIRKFNSLTSKSNFGISIQAGEYCSELRDEGTGKRWWPNVMAANTISFAQFSLQPGENIASVKLTIPANFRKGMIIVGLDQMSANIGEQKYSTIRGNWVSMPGHSARNSFPGTLTCGIYPSCTQHYVVVQNGQ